MRRGCKSNAGDWPTVRCTIVSDATSGTFRVVIKHPRAGKRRRGHADSTARAAFDQYAIDQPGSLQLHELSSLLAATLSLHEAQCTEYAKAIFKKLDAMDGVVDGRIGWKAFRAFYRRALASDAARSELTRTALARAAHSDSVHARARESFRLYDVDRSGTLDAAELGCLLRFALGGLAKELEEPEWEALVADTLRRGDQDANGTWDVDEFTAFFSSCMASEKLARTYERKLRRRRAATLVGADAILAIGCDPRWLDLEQVEQEHVSKLEEEVGGAPRSPCTVASELFTKQMP